MEALIGMKSWLSGAAVLVRPVALIYLMLSTSVLGAEHKALSLGEALLLSSSKHPSVLGRRSDAIAADDRLDGARWQRFPQLSVQSYAANAGGAQGALAVQVPLWTFGRIEAEIEAARSKLAAAQSSVAVSQLSIMEAVVFAFVELARIRQRAQAAAMSRREHERLKDLIERRVTNEISSKADLTLVQARLGQVISEEAQFEAQAATARSSLEQALGQVVHQVVPLASRAQVFADSAAAVDAVLAYSPDLRRLEQEVEAARRDVEAKRANLFPQVVAKYRQNLVSNPLDPSRAYVGIEYQSGSGLSAAAVVREAQARVESIRADRESRAQALSERARNDWTNAALLGRQHSDLRRTAEATASVAESFDRQYVVGRKSWLEALNAHREVAQTQYALADAYWGSQLAIYRLDLLSGRLGSEFMSTEDRSR